MLETDATGNSSEKISKLNIDTLTTEYRNQRKMLENLVVINTPFWMELKKSIITEQCR